ncbi:MAG: peptidase M23 [Bacteroidetes bacterium]|nr:peptidase M23 [Bacteroidota bacterium]MBK9671644.1 peptidase M23 [Bacteroidota bacterium]MBK9800535.1 peptidase M23 [Bacteroidota bacterium]MBP6412129.1 peptidase M23 [Bacteroidia bacterium]
MKISILSVTAASIISFVVLTSCSSPEKKVDTAQENVTNAQAELAKANEEYLADVENYRKETAEKIEQNEKDLAAFKLKISNEKKDAKAAYTKRIAELDEKNKGLKQKMNEYKEDGKDNWNAFKSEFNHDMEEMGKAFKDLTVNNVKK